MTNVREGRIIMSMVSFVKIHQNTVKSMENAIADSLKLVDYSFRKDIENVVIKPNLCYYWDASTGQTTDPRFVAALINIIREKISTNVNISLVESDASAMVCKHAFRFLGYEKLAKEYNVTLVNLAGEASQVSKVEVGKRTFEIMIPQIIQKADLKINISKIKYTMKGIELTCALKNIFGCNPFQKKYTYHPRLGETIVALNKAMKFDLCLIDGNIVSGIQPRRIGLVMASQDPVAIDSAAAEIASINPKKIKYLQLASREGLGNTRFTVKGLPLKQFKKTYPKKNLKKKLMGRAFAIVIKMGLGKRLGIA
jgi:uncharacterized protein (DUF362 family)